jgi:hypothetical protein
VKLASAGKSKVVFSRRKMFVDSVGDNTARNKLKLEQPADGFLFGGKLSVLCKAMKDGGTVSVQCTL